MKCKNCPCDIKGGLKNLRDFHDRERSKMPFGNQRAFFVKIWGRLHKSAADLAQIPRSVMQAPAMASPAAAVASTYIVPSIDLPKPPQAANSIHGLYAMVKRGSNESQEQNKLANEAA